MGAFQDFARPRHLLQDVFGLGGPRGLPALSSPRFAEVIADSWRFLQRERDVRILGYVIMENHLHWIAVGDDLAKEVGDFKSFTARAIIDQLERSGPASLLEELRHYKLRHKSDQRYQFWQEGSHPQQIQSVEMMWQKLQYIHDNPIRRGYVDDPAAWRYSSARNYAGRPGLIEVDQSWR